MTITKDTLNEWEKVANFFIVASLIFLLVVIWAYNIDSCYRCDFDGNSTKDVMRMFYDKCVAPFSRLADLTNLSSLGLQTEDIPE